MSREERLRLLNEQYGSWTAKNGTPGMSRYIDVYVRSGDDWKAVSAQITRPAQRA